PVPDRRRDDAVGRHAVARGGNPAHRAPPPPRPAVAAPAGGPRGVYLHAYPRAPPCPCRGCRPSRPHRRPPPRAPAVAAPPRPSPLTDYWLSFGDVLRSPVYWNQIVLNLIVQAVTVGIFATAAWARFTSKDVLA